MQGSFWAVSGRSYRAIFSPDDLLEGETLVEGDPPVFPTDYVAEAEAKRTQLLDDANSVTADWRTELVLGIIADSDKLRLTDWMKYIKAVKAVDTSFAPEVTWPDAPEM